MDGFSIIQNFFSRMKCNHCDAHLEPEGIELIQHKGGTYLVNVQCVHCERQMGTAMVGLEGAEISGRPRRKKYKDPELTPAEMRRLSIYQPVSFDDVLDAHDFFSNLGADWQKYLPPESRQSETDSASESQAS